MKGVAEDVLSDVVNHKPDPALGDDPNTITGMKLTSPRPLPSLDQEAF